jgi:DNA repair protein RecN (Recombination protein N)
MEKLHDYDTYLTHLSVSMEKQEKQVQALSEEISSIRQEAAGRLTASIVEALKELNFLDVSFTMKFERRKEYTPNGIDDAEFFISTNPGEPLKPLEKVASGGELSRIMLAIKTVMAENDEIGTLIFDEIDNGISGRTAQMVSEKMNILGKHHQVICITHLPQIAAMADTHFLIEKSVMNQSTVSNIKKLNPDESVSELARMLGGVEITDTVYQNAREMKQMAYMKK